MSQFNDLFVRDTWGDDGTEPVPSYNVAGSPDIIPYADQTITAEQLISSYSSGTLLDKGVIAGHLNNIYVRAKNNAPGATTGQLHLYYASPNLLTQPSTWKQNEVTNGNGNKYANLSATTNQQIVAGDQPFYFSPSTSLGDHFCFLAAIEKQGRPSPIPVSDFTRWQGFVDWVRSHANVAWHNVNILHAPGSDGYYKEAYFFDNIDTTSQFHGFQMDYRNVPDGAFLHLYALPNPSVGFAGFDTSITIQNGQGTGSLGSGQMFPAGYSTTVFATCQFPNGRPITTVISNVTSLGYVAAPALAAHERFRPLMLTDTRIQAEGVAAGGAFVKIMTCTCIMPGTSS